MYQATHGYLGVPSNTVKRLEDGTFIPFDPANTDYQAYLKWLDGYTWTPEGWIQTSGPNTPEPADQQPE